MTKKKKAFSMIEIMVAGSLALMLGVLVSVTITNSTNALRQNNIVIESDSKAREFSSYMQKYLSSADKRSYCEVTDSSLGCLTIGKNNEDSVIINYSKPSPSSPVESISFFSYYCDKRGDNRDCLNGELINPSEVKISYIENTANSYENELVICKKLPTLTSGGKSLITDLQKSNLSSTEVPSSIDAPCAGSSLKKVYSVRGVSKYVPGGSIFNLIGVDGQPIPCVTTASGEIHQRSCLSLIETIRVNAKFDWTQSGSRITVSKSRFNEKTTKVELYVSTLGKE